MILITRFAAGVTDAARSRRRTVGNTPGPPKGAPDGSAGAPPMPSATAREHRSGVGEEIGAQAGQGAIEQPGDVHLRDAEPAADLALGQLGAEAQGEDGAVALRQGGDRRLEGPRQSMSS